MKNSHIHTKVSLVNLKFCCCCCWFSCYLMCNSCNCVDCSPPGSSVHGTLQARVLEWGAISFSGGSSQFRNLTLVSCTAGRFFTNRAMNEAQSFAAKSLQSCPTLCSPIDGSPPGSPVPGILQARTLEWVAMSFSNAWNWKVKVKSPSVSNSLWPHGLQPTRLLRPWDFPGKSTGVGCHC